MTHNFKDKVLVNFFFHNEDFVNTERAVKAIEFQVKILEKYGIKGDLWFTGLTAENLLKNSPETIARIKEKDLVIGYHGDFHCPFPTPLERICGLKWDASIQEIKKWETSLLDPITGRLDPSKNGGLKGVESIFDKEPIISTGAVLGGASACFVHKQLGVKMIFCPQYRDGYPMHWFMGMLSYPQTQATSFWGVVHAKYKHGGMAHDPNPFLSENAGLIEYFEYLISTKKINPFSFISIPMHDYDFYCPHGWIEYDTCALPQSWAQCYGIRRVNPYRVYKPSLLTENEQAEVFKEYERIIEFCDNNHEIQIVTSQDLYEMVQPLKIEKTLTCNQVIQSVSYLLAQWRGDSPPKYISLKNDFFLSLCDAFQAIVLSLKYYVRHGNLPSEIMIREILGPTDTPYYFGFPSFRPAKQVDWLPPSDVTIYQTRERISRPPKLVKMKVFLDAIETLTIEDRIPGIFELPNAIGKLNSAEFLYLAAQAYSKIVDGQNSAHLFYEESCVLPLEVLDSDAFTSIAGPLDRKQRWFLQLQSWTLKPAVFRYEGDN